MLYNQTHGVLFKIMKMELYRIDYTLVGLTNPNCLRLLPMTSSKLTQKVVIGDKEGVTTVFFIKKGEVHVTFKTLPSLPITNVTLGGSMGSIQDKIFISSGNEVHGYTKKGKMFLSFETQLLEDIKLMHVSGSDLLVSSAYIYHHYSDCKLTDTYISSDLINDMIPLNTLKVRRLITVLACNDQVLRVLDGPMIIQSLTLENNPIKLHLHNGDGGRNGDHLLVGTTDGQVHLIHVNRLGPMSILWTIENEKNKSEITCITCFNVLKVGYSDVIIGRQDGSVEVYSSNSQTDDASSDSYETPTLQFLYHLAISGWTTKLKITLAICSLTVGKLSDEHFLTEIGVRVSSFNSQSKRMFDILRTKTQLCTCNESVISIQGGYVRNVNFEEILVTTYTGWLFGLTTEMPEKSITATVDHYNQNYGISKDEKQKILKLKTEIEEIEAKVLKEREKYLIMTKDDSHAISRLRYLTISNKMSLNKEEASYTITIETETDIDNILVQCDVSIQLLDVDKNSAVVSYSNCEQLSGNAVLATYRCQLNTTRLELKFHAKEGQKGILQTYITPLTQPKSCQLRKFPIKPLLLHCRIQNAELNESYNTIRLKGTFSLAEMHSWISQCLPDIPEKLPNEDKIEYTFQSVFIGTLLKCSYGRGEAEFKSNNISTVSIVKDVITKEATKKKIRLDISSATHSESVFSTLRLLDPKLEKLYQLERQIKILEALKDIDTAQADSLSGHLTLEYKYILDNESEIRSQLSQSHYLERLQDAVIDLFIDWHKYKGLSAKPKLPLFIETLKEHYNYEEICSYFAY